MYSRINIIALLASIVLAIGCPQEQEKEPEFPIERRELEIRSLFADILDMPEHERKNGESGLKTVVIKHSVTVYHILNKPSVIAEAGMPDQMSQWLAPLREKLAGVPFSHLQKALLQAENSEFDGYDNSLNETLKTINFNGIEYLRDIKIPDVGHNWTEFLTNVLEEYFKQLDTVDKRRILAYSLRHTTTKSSKVDQLLSVISASGPFFQKAMQLLCDFLKKTPNENSNSEFLALKEGLGKVKDGLPSIDPYYVKKYEKDLESLGAKIEVGTSLGAASVGEVFEARFWPKGKSGDGRAIVIKLMRPGIEAVAKREEVFFKAQAARVSPMMEASFSQMSKQIFEELDYREELKKLRLGGEVYGTSEKENIRVVNPINEFPNDKHWMAMEYGVGKTLRAAREKKNSQKSPRRMKLELMSKAILLDRFATSIMENAFFREKFAFFHGDLHAGNIIIRFDDSIDAIMDYKKISAESITKADVKQLIAIRNMQGFPYIQLILVDFGNAHALSTSQSKALFNLFISAAEISKSPEAFLKAFGELTQGLTDIDPQVLSVMNAKIASMKVEISPAFDPANGFKEPYERVGIANDILMNNDVVIPGVVYALIRSLGMLASTYNELKDDAESLKFNFERFHLGDTMTWAVIHNVKFPVLNWLVQIARGYIPEFIATRQANTAKLVFSEENASAMAKNAASEIWGLIKKLWNKSAQFSY